MLSSKMAQFVVILSTALCSIGIVIEISTFFDRGFAVLFFATEFEVH
jgi:hypothetical protein